MSRFTRIEQLSGWRRLALHMWGRPSDPTVYGNLDVRMRKALSYLDTVNRSHPGTEVTVTHLVVKAIAKAMAAWPESNAIISRRRLYVRDSIDVYCQVATEAGSDLSGVKIANADRKSVVEIAQELRERVVRVHERKDHGSERTKSTLARIPHSLLGPVMRTVESLIYDLGLDLSRFGVESDQFGGAMVSNVGMFGIGNGLAPLVPASRTPMVLLVGRVEDQPVVEDGKLAVAPKMTIGCTFDHRVIDGYQAGQMSKIVVDALEDPFTQLGLPNRSNSADGRDDQARPGRSDTDPIDSAYTDRSPRSDPPRHQHRAAERD